MDLVLENDDCSSPSVDRDYWKEEEQAGGRWMDGLSDHSYKDTENVSSRRRDRKGTNASESDTEPINLPAKNDVFVAHSEACWKAEVQAYYVSGWKHGWSGDSYMDTAKASSRKRKGYNESRTGKKYHVYMALEDEPSTKEESQRTSYSNYASKSSREVLEEGEVSKRARLLSREESKLGFCK